MLVKTPIQKGLPFLSTNIIVMENTKIAYKRMPQFDVLKLFAIYLVIWGHCIQYLISRYPPEEPMWYFIYSFHMPLFMIVSGFFSVSSNKLSFVKLITKKSEQLILPMFSWTIIIVLIEPYFNNPLSYDFINSFWFLKSCFICYIFSYIVLYTQFSNFLLIGLSIIVSQFVPVYNIPVMYPCFMFGILLNRTFKLQELVCKYWILVGCVFLVLLFLSDWSIMNCINFRRAILSKDWIDIGLYWYGRLCKIGLGIIGSLTFIGCFNAFYKAIGDNKVINMISLFGQYTLGIYILQTILVCVIMTYFVDCDDLNDLFFNFVVCPVISMIVLIISVCAIYFVCQSKRLSFVLFGK